MSKHPATEPSENEVAADLATTQEFDAPTVSPTLKELLLSDVAKVSALTPPRAKLVQLVAMASSGSSYVTKRTDEILWLVHPDGSNETEPITNHDVAMAVMFHNFEIVTDAPWETPSCVENRVNVRVGSVGIEDAETTLEDVWRFLRTLSEDATNPGLARAVLDETEAYLEVDGLLEDGDLSTQLSRIRSMAENTLKVK